MQLRSFMFLGLIASCLVLDRAFAAPESTSVKPKTTTTPAPTTTPKPSPTPEATCLLEATKPNITAQKFRYQGCIVAELSAYLKFNDSAYLYLGQGIVDSSKSNCEKADDAKVKPRLVIKYECGGIELPINNDEGQVFISGLSGNYELADKQQVLQAKRVPFANSDKLFITSDMKHYYSCPVRQTIQCTNKSLDKTIDLVFGQFSYEAYRNSTSADFYKDAEICDLKSGYSLIVYALAIAVVIAIAYFVVRLIKRDDY